MVGRTKNLLSAGQAGAFETHSNLHSQSFHMQFFWNPGTGKTVVASIVGELLVRMGIIQNSGNSEPVFNEVSREDDSVMVNMRRPADVLVEGLSDRRSDAREQKIALDIKVINGMGPGHFDAIRTGPGVASSRYREEQMLLNDTATRCAANGVTYEPLVFTAQGGCEPHGEALLTRMAKAVADAEGIAPAVAKKEIMERISLSLGRSVAKAVIRRRRPITKAYGGALQRYLAEELEP